MLDIILSDILSATFSIGFLKQELNNNATASNPTVTFIYLSPKISTII
jgi:hypothetical protein